MKKTLLYEDIATLESDVVVLELDRRFLPNSSNKNLYSRVNDINTFNYFQENLREDYSLCVIDSPSSINKKLIVVKMPYEFNFNKVSEVYRKIINFTIKNNYHTLSTTLLGSCINKFKYFDESIDAFKLASNKLDNDLDVNLLFYNEDADYSQRIYKDNDLYNPNDYKKYLLNDPNVRLTNFVVNVKSPINKNNKNVKYDTFDFANFMASYNVMEAYEPKENVINPSDFLCDYARSKGWKLEDTIYRVVSRNEHSKIRSGKTKLKKQYVFKYAIRLNLNKSDFIHLLILSGYSLSPLEPLDVWFYEYYKFNYYQQISSSFSYSDFCSRYYNDFDVLKDLFVNEL